jgi:hypothetical protein
VERAPRYAIYFVPAAQSPLYRYGSSVLGYDCYSGDAVTVPAAFKAAAPDWNELTAAPRRYGFHATLKAPFYLSPDCSEQQLVNAMRNFAALGHPVRTFMPTVGGLGGFFAILPLTAELALDGLAASCTTIFDAYRAPMSPQERARRIALGLSQSQIQNLDRWGYPYVLSEFTFHLTLTGEVAGARRQAIFTILRDGLRGMDAEQPVAVDRIALLKQDTPEASFRVLCEATLNGRPALG